MMIILMTVEVELELFELIDLIFFIESKAFIGMLKMLFGKSLDYFFIF